MPAADRPAGAASLRRLVLAVGLAGLTLAAAVLLAAGSGRAVLALPWLHGGVLLGVLIGWTVLGELVSVPLRHGDAVEELALLEAAVVSNALLLPPRLAMLATLGGLLLATLVRRRAALKAAFNLGTWAAASAVAVPTVYLISGGAHGFGPRVVLAILAGTISFSAVNTWCLSRVLEVTGVKPARRFLREEARLSTFMAVGTAALAAITLALAAEGPTMLPFAAMPAAALVYAYRAAAQEAEERDRAARLLAISRVLASGGDLLPAFLGAVRSAFDAADAVVVLAAGPVLAVSAADPHRLLPAGRPGPALAEAREPGLLATGLPAGWRQAAVAPLVADGHRLGTLILGHRRPRAGFDARTLMLLTSLASALAAALRGAEHLRRLEEERGKLATVVDQSGDGILVLDGAGRIQLWSPALEQITGVPAAEAAERPVAEVLTLCDPVGRPVEWELRADEPRRVVAVELHRPDGERRWLRCAHSAVFDEDGVPLRDVVIVHDLTRERRVERLKADFIATVSHELRTPLTPIAGYIDLLRTRGDRLTDAKRASILDVLAERTAHLGRLVEDLLLASRMGAGDDAPTHAVSMGVHDLAELTRRAAADLGPGRVRISTPQRPVPVAGDDTRVVQIVTNLVGNALKYSAPGSPVEVSVAGRGPLAVVEVTDRGLGIPADELELVFDQFHRVDDPMTSRTGGSGLGLFIARRLARAMEGEVTVRSVLGSGSTFTLTLRASPEASLPAPRSAAPLAGRRGRG